MSPLRQAVDRPPLLPAGPEGLGRRRSRPALRFAEMAVHFDPLNRAAIDLRSDIWLGKPHGDHTLGAGVGAVPMPAVRRRWTARTIARLAAGRPGAASRGAARRRCIRSTRGQPGTQHDIERPRRLQ